MYVPYVRTVDHRHKSPQSPPPPSIAPDHHQRLLRPRGVEQCRGRARGERRPALRAREPQDARALLHGRGTGPLLAGHRLQHRGRLLVGPAVQHADGGLLPGPRVARHAARAGAGKEEERENGLRSGPTRRKRSLKPGRAEYQVVGSPPLQYLRKSYIFDG